MGLIKIRIKRKPIQSDFTEIFKKAFPLSKKVDIHKNFGIVTACSKDFFIGLQVLITSIVHYYDTKMLIFDIGMTPEQVAWCQKQPNATVQPFKFPNYGSHLQYAGAWFKPHYISLSPFKHTIWIDSDAVVVGDLRELLDWAHPNALFTSDHTQVKEFTLNHQSLYSYLPINKPYDIYPYVNTGVLITHKTRDANILKDWRYCVDQACISKEIAASISCWDQGALKWALHKNDLLYLIVTDKKFNYPAKIRQRVFPATSKAIAYWIKTMKPPDPCVVLHWMGSPKPWRNWGNLIGLNL